MVDVQRTFSVRRPPEEVLAYLADFGHAEAWDPGTVSCTREGEGPVQVGTTWHNVSKVLGKETELTYELREWTDRRVLLVGTNKTATSNDDITVEPDGGGSQITYSSHIELHGVAKVADPFMGHTFEKLGDETVEGLTKALDGDGATGA